MDDMIQNPEAQKLAQMLQQQQMQKFLQQLQGAGPMSNADMQMAQMGQAPMVQPDYSNSMPIGGMLPRRGMMQGAVSDMDKRNMMQQGMGQGPMSNADYDIMRKMPH